MPVNQKLRIPYAMARAHWARRQLLDGKAAADPVSIVESTGWLRTLGGIDVYLAFRARSNALSRAAIDQVVADGGLQVVPAVRGCIYLVPGTQAALAIAVAGDQSRKRMDREHEKVGITRGELDEVGAAVLEALSAGPMTTDALRRRLPPGSIRSLGEVGKKVGISSTLPPALRFLEFDRKVERTLAGGCLDTEKYLWRLTSSHTASDQVAGDPAGRNEQLASLFFKQSGPATKVHFAEWSGLSQRDAAAAMDALPLIPVAIEDHDEAAFVWDTDLPMLQEAAPISAITFLAGMDNYLVLHGGAGAAADPHLRQREVLSWGSRRTGGALAETRYLAGRALVVDGGLVGLWEYDPDEGTVVVGTWEPLKASQRKPVALASEELALFVRDELKHARSFSLDTDAAIRQRVARIKAMA